MSLTPDEVALFRETTDSRQKWPRECTKAYDRMLQTETQTTGRIFFDHGGLAAWTAYALTKRSAEGSGHAPNKGKRKRLLVRLEGLPVKDRQAAAVQLAAALEPDRARVEQLVLAACQWTKNSGRKRRHSTASADEMEIHQGNIDVEHLPGVPSPRQPTPLSFSEVAFPRLQQDVLQQDEALQKPDISQLSEEGFPHKHIFVNASVTACNRFFPEFLAGAIRRNPKPDRTSVAAVSITFPHGDMDSKKAFFSIEVMPNKIQHIAWQLFRAHIETEGGLRYLYLGRTRVVFNQSIGLQCCRVGAIPSMFGTGLAAALYANPAHEEERLQEADCTNCISMIVPTTGCASICISLHPREGSNLKDILFPVIA